jgi:hypothetical protein
MAGDERLAFLAGAVADVLGAAAAHSKAAAGESNLAERLAVEPAVDRFVNSADAALLQVSLCRDERKGGCACAALRIRPQGMLHCAKLMQSHS